jgi:hypothetical protein
MGLKLAELSKEGCGSKRYSFASDDDRRDVHISSLFQVCEMFQKYIYVYLDPEVN